MKNLDFIYNRHSVRNFTNESVPQNDIDEIIKAATYAPSAKNVQNWHFVVLKNKHKIQQIAGIVENKNSKLVDSLEDENLKKELVKFRTYHTIFKNAPVLIFVFAGLYKDITVDILKLKNASSEEIQNITRIAPTIQSISASIENLLLSASALGYGACWMVGPSYAFQEIEDFLGFKKEGYFLTSLIPIGIPESIDLKSPKRKPLEEVMTVID
ncbi:MAG: nitroreductase family protein [Alkaliphilus sp.]|nr:nitroreductase family protein [Alkaliphilus sp.]